MAAIEDFMLVEQDKDSHLVFFYCSLCPLTIPFLEAMNAYAYKEGHGRNAYHKRRLELQR